MIIRRAETCRGEAGGGGGGELLDRHVLVFRLLLGAGAFCRCSCRLTQVELYYQPIYIIAALVSCTLYTVDRLCKIKNLIKEGPLYFFRDV